MNCWSCKNFYCMTYYQTGWGQKDSMSCKKTGRVLYEVKDEKECENFEKGKAERWQRYL